MLLPARPVSPLKLRTAFLDRDGVINEKMPEGRYVRSPCELRLLQGAAEAIARLNRAHIRTLVVTNQRGIALGLYTMNDVEAIHAALQRLLAASGAHVDRFYVCPHDKGQCNCRKPLPGLYERALAEFPDIKAAASVLIGDSLSDIEFGRRVDMHTVFIEGESSRRGQDAEAARALADFRSRCLSEAVETLLAKTTE